MKRIYEWIFDEAESEKQRALTTQAGTYTLGDLKKETDQYIALLKQTGKIKGKKVAFIVPVIPSYLSLMLAISRLGGTIVPISHLLRKEDLSQMLKMIDPHIIFIVKEFNQFSFSEITHQWAAAEKTKSIIFESEDCFTWESHITEGPPKAEDENPSEFIICTSGSTGTPKGIMANAEFFHYAELALDEILKYKPLDQLFIVVPVSGLFGLCLLLATVHKNIHLIVTESFSFSEVLQLFKETDSNKFVTSPSLFRALYMMGNKIENLGFEQLESVVLGGENITGEFLDIISDVENCYFGSVYGLTELGGIMYTEKDIRENLELSMLPGVESKIESRTEESIGDLWVKTGAGFLGYYKRDDLTKEVYKNEWFDTGDLVKTNKNNKIEIIGRKKDMIKKGGQQVIPGEIEKLLAEHEKVEKAIVVGVPHSVYGEEVVGFMIVNDSLDMNELFALCRDRLARFKVPDRLIVIDDFPISQGKADKVTLRKWAAEKK